MNFLIEVTKYLIYLTILSFLFHLIWEWVEHAVPGFSDIKQVEVINSGEMQKDIQKVEVVNYDDIVQRK